MIDRREFLAGAAAALTLTTTKLLWADGSERHIRRFSRCYAPHFGTFRHHAGCDPLDQIKFLADHGFTAVEDAGLRARPPRVQERIGQELARRGMSAGLFVAVAEFGRPLFASGSKDLRDHVLREIRSTVETAQRVGGRFLGVVPGKQATGIPEKVQANHALTTLRYGADICEANDLIMVLEPIDHGVGPSRLFLRSARQAAELCRAVGRPSCRVLLDVFQQAAVGEDLPRLVAVTADVLGYVQLADYPGRKEPGTGVVDFPRLLCALDKIGYRGPLGMEHGNAVPGPEGEQAVLEAYSRLDRPGREFAFRLPLLSGFRSAVRSGLIPSVYDTERKSHC
jgi:hydroxypyruvate isomerase